MTHRPLPWELVNRDHTITGKPMTEIIDAKWHTVCDNDPLHPQAVSQADQSLIVTSVNAHAALVAALEACRDHIIGTTGARAGSDSEAMVQEANAALELARKGGA